MVIRPTPAGSGERTTWMLSRPMASTIALKIRLQPRRTPPPQRVHPGRDWFFVIEGRVTMTPHAVAAIDRPAELIMIFDRDGQRAHVHDQTKAG